MNFDVLHVVKNLTERIEKAKIKLLRLKALIQNVTNELDGMPHAHNGTSRVEQLAVAITDCQKKIKELCSIRIDCRIELSAWLGSQLKDEAQVQVLFLRYGLCKPFAVIARELRYSESSVFRLHRLGLKALEIKQSLAEIWQFDTAIRQSA